MTSKKRLTFFIIFSILLMILVVGCDSDSPTTETTPSKQNNLPLGSTPENEEIKETTKGRIIDVYLNGKIITVQTTDGKEEIFYYDGIFLESLETGTEVSINATYDYRNGIFLTRSLNILPADSLSFIQSVDYINSRKATAENIDTSGMNLVYDESDGLSKPAYLVFLSPDGQILAPYFTSLPAASYSVDGLLNTTQNALKASQYITIPIMSKGLWAVKFVAVPGADMSTIMGFEPGLPAKTLAERNGKLWYFKIVKLNTMGKIEKELAACDETCKNFDARYKEQNPNAYSDQVFFFGTLADTEIQKKLFGRGGTPYTLQGYSIGPKENFLGGITCSHLIQDDNGFVKGSKLRLDGWERGALNRAGVCWRNIIDQDKQIPVMHIVTD